MAAALANSTHWWRQDDEALLKRMNEEHAFNEYNTATRESNAVLHPHSSTLDKTSLRQRKCARIRPF